MTKNINHNFDQTYSEWKGWSWMPYDSLTRSAKRYFTGEFNRLSLPPSSRILEVGFGEGGCMEWLQVQGHTVVGAELIDGLVENARNAGFAAEKLNLTEVSLETCETHGLAAASFDAIVAFDVIEHMTAEELVRFLALGSQLLKKGGKVLARFPNGGSSIGLRLQNGDQTHQLALTQSKLNQLLTPTDFEVSFCDNAYRVTGNGRLSPLFAVAFPIRSLLEWFLGSIYFMGRIPLDPALTAILWKKK